MADDTFLAKLQAGLLGRQSNPGGLLADEDLKAARQQALMTMGAQLLQAGGPSAQPIGLGQALGGAMMAGRQAQTASTDGALQSLLLKAQIEKASRPNTENQPNSVREFEYAKQNGFDGSFQDWIVAGGQSSRPSSVQEWEFYNSLPEDKKPLYLEMKRNPNFQVKDVAGAPTLIAPSVVGGTTTTPLSSLPAEIAAAELRKEAEAKAGALGTAEGQLEASITKKGSDAVSTQATLDIAEPLIDVATGSGGGAARDQVAAFFGQSTTGADAIAQLRVLQASLMTSMPRMEGPQSDRDVDLYRQAAGQIGDPTVPNQQKKAAVQTIRQLQKKYQDRAAKQDGTLPKKRYNPETGKIE